MLRTWLVAEGFVCLLGLAGLTISVAQTKTAGSSGNSRSTSGSTLISLSTPDRVQDAVWWPTKGTAPRGAYAATSECEKCHADKFVSTEMAKASARFPNPALLDGQPRLSFRQDPYDYEIARSGNDVIESVTDGHSSISRPLFFAFGEGAVGHTYIYEGDGNLYESHVSYYSSIKSLDLTTGHLQLQFADISQALGRRLEPQEAQKCFGCHTTASTTSSQFDPRQAIEGVTCQSCHGPGSKHVQAMMTGEIEQGRRGIVNPGNLDAASSVDFCGACHRTLGDVIQMNVSGVVTVRFQPFRLEESRCWKNAGKRITCVTCHDPHEALMQDSSAYDRVCVSCHSLELTGERRTGEPKVACPVSKTNCVSCHMPKVEIPGMHHAFADHRIRVVNHNDPYPN